MSLMDHTGQIHGQIKEYLELYAHFNKSPIDLSEIRDMVSGALESPEDNIPQMMLLLHPDVQEKLGVGTVERGETGPFNGGTEVQDEDCGFSKIDGLKCPFDGHNDLEPNEEDHWWPAALGGPTISTNRLVLCKFHNRVKGYSPYLWHWGTEGHSLNWVEVRMERLRRQIIAIS
jgi:hypothetical protein